MEGEIAESAVIMEKMLELNDGDNQGVRYPLFSALIMLGDKKKFEKYDKQFSEETHSAQMLYPRALFAFTVEGDSTNARKLLKKAMDENPFVIQKLLDGNFQLTGVKSYSPGSP
jgi:hypothetical protein